jgi:two-component system response regulator FixJ
MTDRDPFLVRVIDDDAAVRESLEALLAVAGHPVVCYGSAEEYLAAADATTDDDSGCILLDLHMPGMGGFGLMGALHGRADAPPVVVLTAARERALHERAVALGARAVLTKPVPLATLLETLACLGAVRA